MKHCSHVHENTQQKPGSASCGFYIINEVWTRNEQEQLSNRVLPTHLLIDTQE